MLLRYNARVICTAQVQHPLGILKCLNKLRLPLDMSDRDSPQLEQMERQPDETNREVSSDCEILNILLDAAERFSIQAIRRCSLLNATQKAYILSIAQQPRSLKQTARLALRRHVFDVADHVFEYVHRSTMDEIDCNSNFISNDSIGGGRCISRASSSDDSSGMPELEDADDSYVVNRNAYKRYVGDRYSRMTNHQMLRDLLCPHSPVEGEQHDCEQTMLARACGLTTDEMQALRARHDSALDPKMLETLDDVYALPVGYRIPPGSDWPIKLIQINQNYHEYSMRWSSPWILNCNSGYVQMFKDNDSNEQFKSSAMFALFILRQLPLPHTLTQYVLFEN